MGFGPRPVWRRFWGRRGAAASSVLLLGVVGACTLTLPFSLAWYDQQSLDLVRHPPVLSSPVSAAAARPVGGAPPWIAELFHERSGLLGYDALGRSLLYRGLLGGAISLAIGLFAAMVSVCLGVVWGATAGFAGGRLDNLMMRVVDVLYGLPYILMVVLLRLALDAPLRRWLDDARAASVVVLFLAIGANSWLTMARVIRGQVLSLKSAGFVQAARSYGTGWGRILACHLVPNLVGPMVVYGSLIVPQAILSESFLSFLGIGVQRPTPTWGVLAADGLQAINSVVNDWWLIVFPGAALSLTLLALNLIGDGLRDALDVRARGA